MGTLSQTGGMGRITWIPAAKPECRCCERIGYVCILYEVVFPMAASTRPGLVEAGHETTQPGSGLMMLPYRQFPRPFIFFSSNIYPFFFFLF
jgi:hypothetical protein